MLGSLLRCGLPALLTICLLACGPCKDGSSPGSGECTCKDGTKLDAADCPACSGIGLKELDRAAAEHQIGGSLTVECGHEYRLQLENPALVVVSLAATGASVVLRVTDSGRQTEFATVTASSVENTVALPLDRGRYVIVVETSAAKASYDASIHISDYAANIAAEEPGRSEETALEVGDLGQVKRFPGYVGGEHGEAFYRLNLETNAALTWQLADVHGRVSAELFVADALLDKTKPLATLDASDSQDDPTKKLALERGAYYVRLVPTSATGALYTLGLTADGYSPNEPSVEPGDDRDSALSLGPLGGLQELGGFVGTTDPEDYYAFELVQNAPVRLALTQVDGSVTGQIFMDSALVDEAQPYAYFVASTDRDGTYAENLAQGTYLLRVIAASHTESLYKVSLSAKVAK